MTSTASFRFKAVRPDGSMDSGVVDAEDRKAAVALIGARGVFPVEVVVHDVSRDRVVRMGSRDLALGLRSLATLLGAGLPISRAIALLDGSAPSSWAAALPELRRRIEQGEPLAEALERSGLPIPPHAVGVVRAGEAGSGLGAAVERAAQLLETRAHARAELMKALSYPLLLAVAGSACVALLVGVVLPRFVGLLSESDQALPAATTFVLWIGGLARPALVAGMATVAVGALAWRAVGHRTAVRVGLHALLLRLPGVGPVRLASASANACSALAALLDAGVSLAAALSNAARASGDRSIEARLAAVRERLIVGEAFSAALTAERAMTPAAIRLVRVGEETGELARMLDHSARIDSDQALRRLHGLIRLVEPGMILLFGGIVMLVAAALLQAMYGLRPFP